MVKQLLTKNGQDKKIQELKVQIQKKKLQNYDLKQQLIKKEKKRKRQLQINNRPEDFPTIYKQYLKEVQQTEVLSEKIFQIYQKQAIELSNLKLRIKINKQKKNKKLSQNNQNNILENVQEIDEQMGNGKENHIQYKKENNRKSQQNNNNKIQAQKKVLPGRGLKIQSSSSQQEYQIEEDPNALLRSVSFMEQRQRANYPQINEDSDQNYYNTIVDIANQQRRDEEQIQQYEKQQQYSGQKYVLDKFGTTDKIYSRYRRRRQSVGRFHGVVLRVNDEYLMHNNKPIQMDVFLQYDWSNLAQLNLKYCKFNDQQWFKFVNHSNMFPNLKILLLTYNLIRTVTQKMLSSFVSLRSIDFGDNYQNSNKNLTQQSISEICSYHRNHPDYKVLYYSPT